jgi:hypothetical protein
MQPHQPISVFKKPDPADIIRWSTATLGLRIAYVCLTCSTASLILVIAADVARAG